VITVQVKNHSTVVADADVKRVVDACNKQIANHFGRVYGIEAQCHFASKDTPLSTYDWQLIVVDDADTAGALGYHETTANGTPIGYCFAKTTRDYGGNWTVTFSHELLELLCDPEINQCVFDQSGSKMYAYECCDACEDDSFAYDIDGVKVSDFVLPAFWLSSTPVHAPLSFTGKVTKPLQILAGGYLAFLDLHNPSKGWQQHTAKAAGQPDTSSRFPRRGIPAAQRRASVTS
jgi:hypothetical protein